MMIVIIIEWYYYTELIFVLNLIYKWYEKCSEQWKNSETSYEFVDAFRAKKELSNNCDIQIFTRETALLDPSKFVLKLILKIEYL